MEELTTKNQRKLLDMLNSGDVDMIILVLSIVYSLPKPGIYINCGRISFNLLIFSKSPSRFGVIWLKDMAPSSEKL